MAEVLSQTRAATDKLRAAGFKRGEYRVRTERNARGEYGDTYIVVWDGKLALARADALVDAGLTVHIYRLEGGRVSVQVDDTHRPDGAGRLYETDYTAGGEAKRLR